MNPRAGFFICKFVFYLLLCIGFNLQSQILKPRYDSLPPPPHNKNMLFYLQRTLDKNTVIYELNYESNGELNKSKPVKVYWLDFDNGWKVSPLTFAQNMFAYGVESELVNEMEKVFKINLVSFKKIDLYLKPTGKEKRYQAHVSLNGKPSLLSKIFVKIVGGTYIKPVVSYIELIGKDLVTGELIREKIKPD